MTKLRDSQYCKLRVLCSCEDEPLILSGQHYSLLCLDRFAFQAVFCVFCLTVFEAEQLWLLILVGEAALSLALQTCNTALSTGHFLISMCFNSLPRDTAFLQLWCSSAFTAH